MQYHTLIWRVLVYSLVLQYINTHTNVVVILEIILVLQLGSVKIINYGR